MERNCMGERYIGCGSRGETIILHGVPGNALGAYLDGSDIIVYGNAQDATGDTMNEGTITIYGSTGDACGLCMRGGEIYVRDDAGYRAGIHMKAYQDKVPVLIIGGRAGSFLGEYQAGGVIVVLGLTESEKPIVGSFPCTGMHGGKIFLRSDCKDIKFPDQVTARKADKKDLKELEEYVSEFCGLFGYNFKEVMNSPFTFVTPDSKNPYRQMYVYN